MLRFFRLCSHAKCKQAHILQESSYQGQKVTGISSFSTAQVKMDSRENGNRSPVSFQNVIVMRHGHRLDNFEPLWASTAARPWDPPLAPDGRVLAFRTGRRFRQSLGYPIHRVFVSPFLRCVQTTSEIVTALSAVDDAPDAVTGDSVPIDPSKVKVFIEYGLCEMMNNVAIRPDVAPKDGNCRFDISLLSEREAMLPAGTLDSKAERVCKKLPQWGESALLARARYQQTFKELADKYPTENLLLVTHGEGLRTALKDAKVYRLQYCAYVELRRPIFEKDQSFTAGEFDVLTDSGQTGISYMLPTPPPNDAAQSS